MRKGEIIVAVFLIILSFFTIYGSVEAGYGWTQWGPASGFVSFYLGIITLICATIVLFVNLFRKKKEEQEEAFFESHEGLKIVLYISVLTLLYTIGIIYLGIYISSAILCVIFAKWLGRHSWAVSIVFSILLTVITYWGLEKGLHISLPKSFLYAKDILPV